jgi:hypothetical protein
MLTKVQNVAQAHESVWPQEKQTPYSPVNLNILSSRQSRLTAGSVGTAAPSAPS